LAYRLVITGAARKDLDQLPKEVLERADPKILALAWKSSKVSRISTESA
jgi:hypothetical protein